MRDPGLPQHSKLDSGVDVELADRVLGRSASGHDRHDVGGMPGIRGGVRRNSRCDRCANRDASRSWQSSALGVRISLWRRGYARILVLAAIGLGTVLVRATARTRRPDPRWHGHPCDLESGDLRRVSLRLSERVVAPSTSPRAFGKTGEKIESTLAISFDALRTMLRQQNLLARQACR